MVQRGNKKRSCLEWEYIYKDIVINMGSGGGSVGRAVASFTRDPQLESQRLQILSATNVYDNK